MEKRSLGKTGIEVSILGLGGGPLGDERLEDRAVHALIERALELGINLFDTARSYGASERRLGEALRVHRDRVVLSTKVGYGVEGHADWTGSCITAGVERALRELKTDHLDVVHLHSCPQSILHHSDVMDAVDRMLESGKVRAAGYAGEESDLEAAIATGRFAVIQVSVNPLDQRAARERLPGLSHLGVLAKRALANHVFHGIGADAGPDRIAYRTRFEAMGLDASSTDWPDVSLRFAAFTEGVSAALVGTTRTEHLEAAVRSIARGPLDAAERASLEARFDAVGGGFGGII